MSCCSFARVEVKINRRYFIMGCFLLGGCGFRPIYKQGSQAADLAGLINIVIKPGRNAYELRSRLLQRFGVPKTTNYIVDYDLNVTESQSLITSDIDIIRYNLIAKIKYKIVQSGTDSVLFTDSLNESTSYSATAQVYPTQVAREAGHIRLMHVIADKIYTRLSITAKDWMQ